MKTTLRQVLDYIKKYRPLMILSVLLAAVTVALSLYIPILAGNAIDTLAGRGNVDFESLVSYLLQILTVALVCAVLQWIMNTVNNRITFEVIRDVRNDAFMKIQKMPLKYIDAHPAGETVSRIIADTDQFADGLLMGFTRIFTGIVTVLITLIFMIKIHLGVAAVVALLTPLSLLVARFIAKRSHNMFRAQSVTRGMQTAYIDEMIGNAKTVKAFSYEDTALGDFDKINSELQKHSLKATFFSSLVNPSTRFVNNLVYAAVALTGALAVIGGSITVGELACFLTYAGQYTKPFNEISGVVTELQNAFVCAARIFEIINGETEKPDREDAKILTDVVGNVKFDGVDFSYSPDTPLIKGLNLSVKGGQRIAIVGPTGCGKTTLINLLMRFYDINSGAIYIDENSIYDIKKNSLRQSFGMVLQDTWLRTGTVRDNIAFSKPDATDEEIAEAAKGAHAHGFIERLENGYDTVIGEDGGNLSQGQKQLLCIARLMLCKPPMLILDEATSSIDTRTEQKISDAFSELMTGKTSFVVAHRLSTIVNADKILVMNKGNIVECGTHSELISKKGFYYNLYNSQYENR